MVEDFSKKYFDDSKDKKCPGEKFENISSSTYHSSAFYLGKKRS